METTSELIDLEYMVEFEDGLRPRLIVYGIDTEAGEVYEAHAGIGVIVSAGYRVSQTVNDDSEGGIVVGGVGMGTTLGTSVILDEDRGKLPETEDWELKGNEEHRRDGCNVIKVKNPNHIRPAIDRHVQLYGEQFHELEERFENIFRGFIGDHSGYANY